MTEELKPCPWCGSTQLFYSTSIVSAASMVNCSQCGGRHAAAAWNTRAESADVERLRARITELEAAQAWRPVDSAPADCDLLLYCPDSGPTNEARIELRQFKNTRAGSMHAWATHWMPLPKGPEDLAVYMTTSTGSTTPPMRGLEES